MQGQRDVHRLFQGEFLSLPNRHFRPNGAGRDTLASRSEKLRLGGIGSLVARNFWRIR